MILRIQVIDLFTDWTISEINLKLFVNPKCIFYRCISFKFQWCKGIYQYEIVNTKLHKWISINIYYTKTQIYNILPSITKLLQIIPGFNVFDSDGCEYSSDSHEFE